MAMPSVKSFQFPRATVFVAHIALLALVTEFGAGCDQAPEPEATAPPARASSTLARIKWLDSHGTVTPERWLASRAVQADLEDSDPRVAAMHTKLNRAAQHFGDPPRMIANRAVQLEEMLAAQGIEESAPELIAQLTSAVSESGPEEGFGSVCQHYFNLRQQGVGRDAALTQLMRTSRNGPDVSIQRG